MSRPQKVSHPCINKNLNNNVAADHKHINRISYFFAGPGKDADMKARAKLTDSIHQEFADGCIGCSKGAFSLKVRDSTKPYQVPQQCMVNTIQEPFKKL